MKAERVLPVTLFVALALTFWRANQDKQNIHFPRPYRFVGIAVAWTALAVLATAAPSVASAFAVAFDAVIALRPTAADPGLSGGVNSLPAGGGRQPVPL